MTGAKKDSTPKVEPEVTEVETEEVATPVAEESESARYLRIRREAKEQAAVTIAADLKAAKKARDKRWGKAPEIEGQAEFLAEARRIEAAMQAPASTPKED